MPRAIVSHFLHFKSDIALPAIDLSEKNVPCDFVELVAYIRYALLVVDMTTNKYRAAYRQAIQLEREASQLRKIFLYEMVVHELVEVGLGVFHRAPFECIEMVVHKLVAVRLDNWFTLIARLSDHSNRQS